ncbi:hypothetical protein NG799_04810 [Laspinema sp. D1]|uniref:Transposase n=2 Tax=Laspinema TaxID=2584823 RepID=A0ABT2MNV1_9CYAN|nr:hypothetical protein [Laspinema sp. D2a]
MPVPPAVYYMDDSPVRLYNGHSTVPETAIGSSPKTILLGLEWKSGYWGADGIFERGDRLPSPQDSYPTPADLPRLTPQNWIHLSRIGQQRIMPFSVAVEMPECL